MWSRSYAIAAGPLILMITSAGEFSVPLCTPRLNSRFLYIAFTLHMAAQHNSDSFFTVVPVALIVANTTLCTLLIAGRIWYDNITIPWAVTHCHYSQVHASRAQPLFYDHW